MLNFKNYSLNENKMNYKCIVVKCEDQEEFTNLQLYLFDNGYEWVSSYTDIMELDNLPVYIFINIEYKKFFKSRKFELEGSGLDDLHNRIMLTAKTRVANDNIERNSEINPTIIDFKYIKLFSIDYFIKNKDIKPSYKSKKINKLNEINNDENDANEIVILIKSLDEFNLLEEKLNDINFEICSSIKKDYEVNHEQTYSNGMLIFIDIFDWSTCVMEYDNFVSTYDGSIRGKSLFDGVLDKIFTINDTKRIISILSRKSLNIPIYKPRKIIKESIDYYPYRFKTEEEMIKDFGEDWRDGYDRDDNDIFDSCGWVEEMDILLGTDFPIDISQLNDEDDNRPLYNRFRSDLTSSNSWTITWDMLTKNKPKSPSYKSREIIKESKYKEHDFYVLCENYDDALELQNYLQDIGYGWHGKNDKDIIQKYAEMHIFILRIDFIKKDIVYAEFTDNEFINLNNYQLLLNYTKDKKDTKNILKHGIDKPSYKPNKIDRHFESVIEYPYRFKTEEEFLETLGRYWRRLIINGWVEEMDIFLGQVYPFTKEEIKKLTDINEMYLPQYKIWSISWDMLTKNRPIVPSYKPKIIEK